ncbi:MAG: fibronectin type III domain-containing protein [Candidatus Kaiserbacteria bacterium]|nr:fibronectin type III domain-containing protein [Candidatus Kaiserbacteria bacterium]
MFTKSIAIQARILPILGMFCAGVTASFILFTSPVFAIEQTHAVSVSDSTEKAAPEAPENLRVRSVTDETITLDWNTPADNGTPIIGYSLRYYERESCDLPFSVAVITHAVSHTFAGLNSGTTYSFEVRAFGDGAWSEFSNCVSATTVSPEGEEENQLTPTNVAVESFSLEDGEKSHYGIAVRWDLADEEAVRVVTAHGDDQCVYPIREVQTKKNNTFFFGLSPEKTYFFTVRAQGGVSDCVSLSTEQEEEPVTDPSPVYRTALELSVDAVTHNTIAVHWTGGEGEYQTTLFADPFCMYPLIRKEAIQESEYTFTKVRPETEYSVRVQANGDFGAVYTSSCQSVTTERDLSLISKQPKAPENVTVTETTLGSISLSWDEPESRSGIDKYHVHKYAGDQCSGGSLGFDIAPGSEAVILTAGGTVLAANTVYSFTIRARSNGLWGDFSDCVSATTKHPKAPNVPENLRAERVTGTSVSLTWDKPADNGSSIIAYEVRRYADHRCVTHYDEVTNDRLKRSATAYDLTPGSTHFFIVRAQNEIGWSSFSPCVSVTTTQKGATGPANIRLNSVTDDSFIVLWDSKDKDQSYRVSLYADKTCVYPIMSRRVTGTEYTFTNLTPGATYHVDVQLFGGFGRESTCLSVTLETGVPKHKAPSVPTNVQVTGTTRNSVSLSWDAPGNVDVIDKYHIRKYTGDACGSRNLGEQVVTSESATVTTAGGYRLTPDTTYSFAIRARSNGRWSDLSSCISATTDPAVAPEAPENLRAHQVSDRSIVMTWDKAEDNGSPVTEYEVRRYADSQCVTHFTTERGDMVKLRAGFVRLSAGTAYHFTVQAKNEAGWGPLSDCVKVVTEEVRGKGSAAPTNVTAADATQNTISLTWDAPVSEDPIEKYHVHKYVGRLCEGGSGFDEVEDTSAVVTGIGSKLLLPGTDYSFTVRARINGKWSEPSACVSATTESLSVPAVPTNVQSISDVSGHVTVTWDVDAADEIAQSQVTLYADDTCSYPVRTNKVKGAEHTFTSLSSGITYYAHVRSENRIGWGPVSECVMTEEIAPLEEKDPLQDGEIEIIRADRVSSDAAVVSWKTSRDVIRSRVSLYGDNTCIYPLDHKDVTGTQHTFTGLTNGPYFTNVRSENKAGESTTSPCITVPVFVSEQPSAATTDEGRGVQTDRVSFDTVIVTWDVTNDIVRSRISLYGDSACIYPLQHKDVAGTRHVFTNLTNGPYFTSVRSENKAGESTISPCIAIPSLTNGGF